MRESFLTFGAPQITEEDIAEVVDTLRSGWIGTGPKVLRFEAAFADLLGAAQAVAVSSCTAALGLALEIGGVGPGDEVITTPITFPATANVIVHRGARPVFADVERATGNIAIEEIARRITPRTKAIIPVHLAGRPCDMAAIMALARAHDLLVIEDAAHAIEARYRGAQVGRIGHFGAFSFYPTKSVTTGEGGMLTTADEGWAQEARVLRQHGIDADAWRRYSAPGHTLYETVQPGYKQNMTDLQAALGLHQLERLGENLARRTAIWRKYDEAFRGLAALALPPPVEEVGSVHARHLYTVMVQPEAAGLTRDEMIVRLTAAGIGTGVHYTALHLHKYYRETYGYRPDDLPEALWVSERTLSLPLSNRMTLQDADDVIGAVRRVLGVA